MTTRLTKADTLLLRWRAVSPTCIPRTTCLVVLLEDFLDTTPATTLVSPILLSHPTMSLLLTPVKATLSSPLPTWAIPTSNHLASNQITKEGRACERPLLRFPWDLICEINIARASDQPTCSRLPPDPELQQPPTSAASPRATRRATPQRLLPPPSIFPCREHRDSGLPEPITRCLR